MMVFDARDLVRLAEEARSHEAMREYVRRYRALLERRVCRIVDALASADLDQAMDAVLSLKASSAMVGACETAELAHRLKVALSGGDLPRARVTAAMLTPATRQLDSLLGEFLAEEDCCVPGGGTTSRVFPCDSPRHAQCG